MLAMCAPDASTGGPSAGGALFLQCVAEELEQLSCSQSSSEEHRSMTSSQLRMEAAPFGAPPWPAIWCLQLLPAGVFSSRESVGSEQDVRFFVVVSIFFRFVCFLSIRSHVDYCL